MLASGDMFEFGETLTELNTTFGWEEINCNVGSTLLVAFNSVSGEHHYVCLSNDIDPTNGGIGEVIFTDGTCLFYLRITKTIGVTRRTPVRLVGATATQKCVPGRLISCSIDVGEFTITLGELR